jgi:hypothetical protein
VLRNPNIAPGAQGIAIALRWKSRVSGRRIRSQTATREHCFARFRFFISWFKREEVTFFRSPEAKCAGAEQTTELTWTPQTGQNFWWQPVLYRIAWLTTPTIAAHRACIDPKTQNREGLLPAQQATEKLSHPADELRLPDPRKQPRRQHFRIKLALTRVGGGVLD